MPTMTIILLFILAFVQAPAGTSENELLERGLELESEGKYEEALDTWANAFSELPSPSLTVGREYIRLATEIGSKEHYKVASSIYLWGLSANSIRDSEKEVVRTEIEMLRPLIEGSVYNDWRKRVKKKDPQVLNEMYRFWQAMDPTPGSTQYNERLLEHWERIAHARKEFDRNNRTVYGTDDRGIAYIQFGEPDRKDEGFLEATRGQIIALCAQLVQSCDGNDMSIAIFQIHERPGYEIWIYMNDDETQDNLIQMFGDTPGGGFEAIDGIDELIPFRAFTNSRRYEWASASTANPGQQRISPGMVLQYLYYGQIAGKDTFFANRFNELDFIMNGDPERSGRFQGFITRNQTKHEKLEIEAANPDEFSTYERDLLQLPIEMFHYRFLDENNQPLIVSFMQSYPGVPFVQDYGHNEKRYLAEDPDMEILDVIDDYELMHSIKVLDQDNVLLLQSRIAANLIIDPTMQTPSSSVFTIPYVSNQKLRIITGAELYNNNPITEPRYDSPFEKTVRGIGKAEEQLPRPLSNDADELQMSDLVFGYQMNENAAEDVLFPFVVANRKQIPQNEALAVHIEVYNLQTDQDGIGRLNINYSIENKRGVNLFQDRETGVNLSLDLATEGRRYIENLEIQTRQLLPGDYRLKLQITDRKSGNKIGKELDFEVVEG